MKPYRACFGTRTGVKMRAASAHFSTTRARSVARLGHILHNLYTTFNRASHSILILMTSSKSRSRAGGVQALQAPENHRAYLSIRGVLYQSAELLRPFQRLHGRCR